MRLVILLNDRLADADEARAAERAGFRVIRRRAEVRAGELVVPRYSAPWHAYGDLADDLEILGAVPVNTRAGHRWLVTFEWAEDEHLRRVTPRTWRDRDFHRCDHPGPFVVRGAASSRKLAWRDLMFAADKRAAVEVASRLARDPDVAAQGIVYRELLELERLGECPVSGIPYVHERRFFAWGGRVFASGFYWTDLPRELWPAPSGEADALAAWVAGCCASRLRFVSFDLARCASGEWVLIELNDGCQAGLQGIDAVGFYRELATAIRAQGRAQ